MINIQKLIEFPDDTGKMEFLDRIKGFYQHGKLAAQGFVNLEAKQRLWDKNPWKVEGKYERNGSRRLLFLTAGFITISNRFF